MANGRTAIVFPGQGSQRQGMGKDFYENIPECRRIYEEASDALGWDVAALCFGEDEKLNLTAFAQPSIVVTEIAMLKAIIDKYGVTPDVFGGHSLGEYTALVAAGVLPLETVLRIVHIRGSLMQDAVPLGQGSMAAVIRKDLSARMIRELLSDLPIDVANINSPNQIVISGRSKAMPEAEERLAKALADENPTRIVALNVSAPFHSRFMHSIEEPFEGELACVRRQMKAENAVKVTSNYTGSFHSSDKEEVIERLVAQLSGTVQWCDNMRALASQADTVYEIGPNRPLRDFFKTIGVTCISLTTLSSAERTFTGN
ncbi:MAG TPA: ACP S-malonyltransferase [Desulfobacterales bacterium]|nr:ACP S-malonyltransferase [Desulfobacterales bacterium]